MKKAVILARVSSKKQETEGLSLEEIQLPQLRQYATDNDLEVVKEFVFQESASKKIRKRFDEMVKYVREHEDVKAIIAFRVDRITRSFRDAVDMDDLRVEHDKELHFVSDRLVLTKDTHGANIQSWDLQVFLAKQQINRLKEDSYNTLQSKIRSKELYGKAPYGYRNETLPDGSKTVVVDEYEAGIARKMYDWYSTGAYSMEQIRTKLKTEFGIKMGKSKVERIFGYHFYYGMMEVKNELYPHKYETIITPELFDMVQDVRNSRGKIKAKYAGLPFTYRAILTCAKCGCTITPERHTKKQKNGNIHKYVYYHCTESKGKHNAEWIEEKQLEKQFAQIFKKMKIPKKDLEDLNNSLKLAHEGKINFDNELLDEYTRKIKAYKERIENAYVDKLDGRITQEQFDDYRKRFRSKQKEYERKLQHLNVIDEDYYITVSYLAELASRSYELFINSESEEKRQIIQLTLLNLSLDDGKLRCEL